MWNICVCVISFFLFISSLINKANLWDLILLVSFLLNSCLLNSFFFALLNEQSEGKKYIFITRPPEGFAPLNTKRKRREQWNGSTPTRQTIPVHVRDFPDKIPVLCSQNLAPSVFLVMKMAVKIERWQDFQRKLKLKSEYTDVWKRHFIWIRRLCFSSCGLTFRVFSCLSELTT